jgi:hypothetical protein
LPNDTIGKKIKEEKKKSKKEIWYFSIRFLFYYTKLIIFYS